MSRDFASIIHDILVGLLKDAQSDEAYEYVMPLYTAWESATSSSSRMKHIHQTIMAGLLDEPTFRDCVRGRDTKLLYKLLSKELPDTLCAPLREVALSLGNPDLFRDDTTKKMWKRIKKLMISLDLHDFVFGKTTMTEQTNSKEQTSKFAAERHERFNKAYRDFLYLVMRTFPPAAPETIIDAYDKAISHDSTAVLERFKKIVLPSLPDVARALQLQNQKADPETIAAVFNPYFGSDSSWFQQLPFIDQLPIDEHWQTKIANVPMPDISKTTSIEEARQLLEASEKHQIMRTVGDLNVTMSGIDSLIYSPIVTHLRNAAVNIMKRKKVDPQTLMPTSTKFDQSTSLEMVKELFHEIPAATNNAITTKDIEQLIGNAIMGNSDIPDSFSEVFSPEMIDFDCLDAVTELPIIGDVLGPVMAAAEGSMTGSTGKPAFAAAPTPAWAQRDDDSS